MIVSIKYVAGQKVIWRGLDEVIETFEVRGSELDTYGNPLVVYRVEGSADWIRESELVAALRHPNADLLMF